MTHGWASLVTVKSILLLGAIGVRAGEKKVYPVVEGGGKPPWAYLPACVRAEHRSQQHEDLMVLAPLLCMLDGRPGTFVELGAFTGVNLSNTVMLERCYNWTGLLIEGSTTNFAQLQQSGRRAKKVHSAVCPGDVDSEVTFAIDGGEVSGEPATRQKPVGRHATNLVKKLRSSRLETVPCSSLARILDRAGYSEMDILFLDVEGAEDKVLSSIDPARFSVVVMEAAGYPNDGGRLETKLEPLLTRAGFRRERSLEERARGAWNPVYVRTNGRMSRVCGVESKECRDRYLASG